MNPELTPREEWRDFAIKAAQIVAAGILVYFVLAILPLLLWAASFKWTDDTQTYPVESYHGDIEKIEVSPGTYFKGRDNRYTVMVSIEMDALSHEPFIQVCETVIPEFLSSRPEEYFDSVQFDVVVGEERYWARLANLPLDCPRVAMSLRIP